MNIDGINSLDAIEGVLKDVAAAKTGDRPLAALMSQMLLVLVEINDSLKTIKARQAIVHREALRDGRKKIKRDVQQDERPHPSSS